MIRRATLADVDALVELAEMEHALSQLSDTPFDGLVVEARMTHCIRSIDSAVFVSAVDGEITGLIAGNAQMNLHNRYHTVYELLWFALDGSGLKLLAALKDWAMKMRATALVVHNYAGIKCPERFNNAMTRKGFAPMGVSYMATLEN